VPVERTSGSAEGDSVFSEPLDGPKSPSPPGGGPSSPEAPAAADHEASSPPNDGPRARETSAAANGESSCIELGIEAADCTDFEKIVANLRHAWTAYTCPKEMIKGHGYLVSLVLDPTKPAELTEGEAREAIAPELHADPNEVVARLTKMARHMSASLTGVAFKIEPSTPQKITVTTGQPVRWDRRVSPVESGKNKQITLTLSAYLGKDEGSPSEVQIKTLVERIQVNVSPWEEFLAAIPTAQQGLAVGATIFGVLSAIWAFLNRSRIGGWFGLKAEAPGKKERRRGRKNS
jgi:hypothetical protein